MKIRCFIFCLSILILTLTHACSSNSSDDVDTTPPNISTKLTYNNDIKSIISNNCIRCHGNSPTEGAPFSLTTYNDVKNYIDRILVRINSSSTPMPPNGQISQDLRDDIQQWKDEGLLEN